jgi:adenine-specific DNA-methyltransferase
MSLRYMGTKRALAPRVRDAVASLEKRGQVADLFSGMGSVATSMASTAPVLTNDALAFTTTFARARFLLGERVPAHQMARDLFPDFCVAYDRLRDDFSLRMSRERTALAFGRGELADFMNTAPHAGNSDWYRRNARRAADSGSVERYRLAVLYFSAGYFSTTQAAELDALRYAIDRFEERGAVSRDWLLAAWLGAAGVVINAPGHTAQFLKPGNDAIYKRIRRQWKRPVWPAFIDQLDAIQAVGTKKWRAGNEVCNDDALTLLESPDFDDVAVVYADPPYTKDHYSRFYHVYETLYRYDFPASRGTGRYPPDRFQTPFSLVRDVEEAFRKLFTGVAKRGLPLVLSYPDNGLLHRGSTRVSALLEEYFSIRTTHHVTLQHSTLGASSGSRTKSAHEGVYVCVP